MKLDEFRNRWVTRPDREMGREGAQMRAGRLTFLPPAHGRGAPRLVFRERASPLPTGSAATRPAGLATRAAWAVVLLIGTGAMAKGLEQVFDYTPAYLNKHFSQFR